MQKLIPSLALLFTLGSAAAASTVQISDTSTRSSSITLSGKVDPKIRSVWIAISKVGESGPAEDLFPLVKNSGFDQRVYLRHGAGEYQVTVRETSEQGHRRLYFDLAHYTVQNKDLVDRSYLLPSPMVQSDHPMIQKLARKITAGLKDPLAQSRAIHDWVASNVAYDTAPFFKGIAKDYTALETLKKRRAYCNGYAHLSAALHRAIGIRARIIFGYATAIGQKTAYHAWNEVLIKNRWVPQDPTWDAGGISVATRQFQFRPSRQYFNPPLALFARDHKPTQIVRHE